MKPLHELIAARVDAWREAGYPHESHPAIAEILDYQVDPETNDPRFLRPPQLRALETYWYLRLVEETPRVVDLYHRFFPETSAFLDALGLQGREVRDLALDGVDGLLDRIADDDEFVHAHRLEAVRETLTLDYPSYILALAMGAGKTILIGAVIATEFAMAKEYPDGDFVQNALVFAPGKTIVEALRELAEVPYDRILPPRMYPGFAAAVSLTFTRDGDPDIPVVRGSLFNVVVTNTGKIRIRKEAVRKKDIGEIFAGAEDDARREVANRRLRTIASLPHLGVFSDEAHHTYGQKLLGRWVKDRETGERRFREAGVKKVRKTVDYLAENTNVVCVVNTTGTPYFKRQPLRDVVIWYGLSRGIRDGILKDVEDNIYAYDYEDEETASLVEEVLTDFFEEYGDVRLSNGAPAKIALYFPKTEDLAELRPTVEATLAGLGLPATIVLRNTSKSTRDEIDAFNRLNHPDSPHRVILLVNKGTEGWNCPSLFACALLRKLKTSSNFVLQAATRCLRQVPGNDRPARIYLSERNRKVLDRQLDKTYGESLADLERTPRERGRTRLVLRKYDMPPVRLTRTVRRIVPAAAADDEDGADASPTLERPVTPTGEIERTTLTLPAERANRSVLRATGENVTIPVEGDTLDPRSAAVELAANYGRPIWPLYEEVRRIYEDDDVPVAHLPELGRQLEEQARSYTVHEEEVDVALALVRRDPRTGKPDRRGWIREPGDDDGADETVYTAEITYYKDRERLLLGTDEVRGLAHDLGFHYTPYDFDSKPERDLFVRLLRDLDLRPDDVEDIYFTGALTDPAKTEFLVEYKDENGRWRNYSPDFLVRRKDGRCVIVEVKAERERHHPVDGEDGRKAMAVRSWLDLNPDTLDYEMIFTDDDVVSMDDVTRVLENAGLTGDPAGARPIPLPDETLRAFCEKWDVETLEVFGSSARGERRAGSDVDLLVTFRDGKKPGMFDFVRMREEIAGLLDREVDILTRASVEKSDNPVRRENILKDAVRVYPV